MTSITTVTAEATSAATSAQPKSSTSIASGRISDASLSRAASTSRTITNPSSAMNGMRSAAMIGGISALRIAIRSAATTAPPNPLTETPGTIHAATSSAAAETSHETRSRSGWKRGRAGSQTTRSPYGTGSGMRKG